MLLSEIASYLGLEFSGKDREITGANTLASATSSEISFLANPKYMDQVATTHAGAVLITEKDAHLTSNALISAQPYVDFARCVQLFSTPQGSLTGQSHQVWIHPDASVHPDAVIYPFVTVERGATIGARTRIFSGVYVGENCQIGEDCCIYPNCSLMAETKIGARVLLHPGVVLGSDGFGFALSASGIVKFPQIGHVVLEDDVEVGANTTIDRAALGQTVVGRGTKIDNLVQLGHNVQVGQNCMIVAQVGIAGSSVLGDQVILAGQAGIAGHLHLGDGCRIGAQAGVGQDVPAGKDYSGTPAMPHSTFLRTSMIMPKLPDLKRRLNRLEKEMAALQKQLADKEE
ncbi:UDP-3-O-(3-hydroxymyristoyl)glucosamine N-acyltransferase [Desulfovibrionales bacterium]